MLTFLSPLFLVGAAAAAVPVILHLLKREPEERVKFAAVKLLKHAPVEHTARHRLRELILLALRVATLVLLALAFARPFFAAAGGATMSGVRIVALDTSYSLSAPGRFDRAKQLAKDAIRRGGAGELVGVVLFDDAAQVVSSPSADHVLAASAIDRAAITFGATRYRAALSAASQALAGRRGTIVVVTDLQESGWDAGDRAVVPDGTTLEIADVGAAPADLAVTGVRPLSDRIVATVHNAGPRARDVRAHLTIDGRAAGDAAASLGPNQSGDVTFAGAPKGAVAAVSVDDPDGMQADNVRFAALAGAGRPGLLVVGGNAAGRDGFYLQQALAAAATGASGYEVTFTTAAQLSTAPEGALTTQTAVVLLSTRGLERRGREALAAYVREGGGLLIAAGPEIDGDVAGDVLGGASTLRIVTSGTRREARTLAPAEVRHPIFRPFAGAAALTLVRFQQAAHIDGSGCQTLARFTTGDKALIECAAGEGRALVFASDLDNRWNDFPLHASFVPFVHESVRYLSSAHANASEYLVGGAPPSVPRVPGVHEIPAARPGAPARRVAVNVDLRESDPARISPEEFQAAVAHLKDSGSFASRVEARQQEDDQHLWQYALALMVVALAAEGVVASRTA